MSVVIIAMTHPQLSVTQSWRESGGKVFVSSRAGALVQAHWADLMRGHTLSMVPDEALVVHMVRSCHSINTFLRHSSQTGFKVAMRVPALLI